MREWNNNEAQDGTEGVTQKFLHPREFLLLSASKGLKFVVNLAKLRVGSIVPYPEKEKWYSLINRAVHQKLIDKGFALFKIEQRKCWRW